MESTSPLSPEQLYHACNLDDLGFESTEQLTGLTETLGQERALDAIAFSVGIKHEGYNLYVMGSPGVGRHWMVTDTLSRLTQSEGRRASDWCYLANFDTPHQPLAVYLPAGMGRVFSKDMHQLVDTLLDAIPTALQSGEFRHQADEITAELKQREEALAKTFDERTRKEGITLIHTPTGYSLVPLKDDKVITPEAFDKLPKVEQERISQALERFRDELRDTLSQIPIWKRDMRLKFKALEQQVVGATLDRLMQELFEKYAGFPDIISYLEAVRGNVLENLQQFLADEDGDGNAVTADDARFTRYQVNLLVDNRDTPGVPVVYEPNPTYQNLLGRIEHVARMGTLATDFTLIKPGVLHRANDGYLILDAEKLLTNPFSWEALKRALKSREVRIESLERQLSLVSTISLEPEPIPIDLKVVLIGERRLYHLLKAYDPDFGQLFRVVADLAEDFSRDPTSDQAFARLIASLQQREKLRPLSREGVARIIEQSARNAGNSMKLSLHMGRLTDLLKEADYWAHQEKSPRIENHHVEQAIEQQTRRVGQLRERLQEEIIEGTLMIDTAGSQLGRVNGLSVIQVGDHAFGMPSRISATARLGHGEVVDIEREVEQGGPIHSKGVLILSAYLNRRYARFQPLSVSASLVFEQTYGEVEGDSASAGELCALLSALGDIPLKQSLAITGSVNQHGEMQPIGGVCEKIEGFFDVCQARGLDGTQGVIIPSANSRDLMLKREVLEAAASGLFHVYAVRHVEPAMELLCGMPAGVAHEDGQYPAHTFNALIQQRLAEWLSIRLALAQQDKDGN